MFGHPTGWVCERKFSLRIRCPAPNEFALRIHFTSFREIHISFMLIRAVRLDPLKVFGPDALHDSIQVKYTKTECSVLHGTGHTQCSPSTMNQGGEREMYAFDQCRRSSQKDRWPRKKPNSSEPIFFWIKSSAKRAFGECLGSKRR